MGNLAFSLSLHYPTPTLEDFLSSLALQLFFKPAKPVSDFLSRNPVNPNPQALCEAGFNFSEDPSLTTSSATRLLKSGLGATLRSCHGLEPDARIQILVPPLVLRLVPLAELPGPLGLGFRRIKEGYRLAVSIKDINTGKPLGIVSEMQ